MKHFLLLIAGFVLAACFGKDGIDDPPGEDGLVFAPRPSPAHGATGVSGYPLLLWSPALSPRPVAYRIYVGSDSVPSSITEDRLQDTVFVPRFLGYERTYFWRVTAMDARDTLDGPVWRFTTAPRGPNRAPVITEPGNLSMPFGHNLILPLSAIDLDQNAIVFSLLSGPVGARVQDRQLSWQPDSGQVGPHAFQIVVEDDGVPPLRDTAAFTITVSLPAASAWTQVQGRAIRPLRALAFADGRVGVAAGEDTIRRTTDGGLTWSPVDHGMARLNPWSCAFASPRAGILAGEGTLYRTADAGMTWTRAPGADVVHAWSVAFRDSLTGVAGSSYGEILDTRDGGSTWTMAVHDELGLGDLLGMAYAGPAAVGVGANGSIVRSLGDGGPWRNVVAGGNEKKTLRSVAFADTVTGVAVGDNGAILRTTDGGLTWAPAAQAATKQHLHCVSFADAQRGLAVGEVGTVLRTGDGGATWTIFPSAPTAGALRAVRFAADGHAVAVGDDGIFRTRNPVAAIP